jgi:hypothetical protein
MALFTPAFDWMMKNEDAQRAFKSVPDAPPGAWAISGINSREFPAEFAAINTIPQPQRGPAVESFYRTNFWNRWFSAITSDDVAKRIFDAGVNEGSGTACKMAQIASNTLSSAQITEDGNWGPNTVEAINECDSGALVAAFQKVRADRYRAIVAANPLDERYLANWLARAEK